MPTAVQTRTTFMMSTLSSIQSPGQKADVAGFLTGRLAAVQCCGADSACLQPWYRCMLVLFAAGGSRVHN